MAICETKQDKKRVIAFIFNYPYKFGRAVGFTKLTTLHNSWIRDMINGIGDKTLQSHRG